MGEHYTDPKQSDKVRYLNESRRKSYAEDDDGDDEMLLPPEEVEVDVELVLPAQYCEDSSTEVYDLYSHSC